MPTEPSKKKYALLSAGVIFLLGLAVYSNTFLASFHFDDFAKIAQNNSLKNLANIPAIWLVHPTRFITYFTFALNYRFNGISVVGYHAVNFLIHFGSALMVFRFILLLFSAPALKSEAIARHARPLALCGALIFLAHPLQTESVTYIFQRAASLAGFFYLAALCLYLQARLLPGAPILRRTIFLLSWLAALLAMFSKENAVTLPLVILAVEFYFLKREKPAQWSYSVPFFLIALVVPVTLYFTRPVTFFDAKRLANEPLKGLYYFLTQPRVMATYMRLLFVPFGQNLDYDYSLSRSLWELPTLSGFLLVGVVLGAAVKMFARHKLLSFGIIWFFLTLSVESSIIPLGDIIFEHRLYLPLAGFSIFLTGAAYYLLEKKNFAITLAVLGCFIAFYSCAAYQRNKVWKDEFTLWNDTVRKSPQKARGYVNRGIACLKEKQYDAGMADFNQAVRLDPASAWIYNNRGALFNLRKEYEPAMKDFNAALEIDPRYAQAYYNRALSLSGKGSYRAALPDFTQAIALDHLYAEAYLNRGVAHDNLGESDAAISDFTDALMIDPDYTAAWLNRGAVLHNRGDYTAAIADFKRALSLSPASASICANLAVASYLKKDCAAATEYFDKAVALGYRPDPEFARRVWQCRE